MLSIFSTKPSVAVLYFKNVSPNKESTDYLRDGITEDIISSFMKIEGINVLPKDYVMPYKDESVKLEKLKDELGDNIKIIDASKDKDEVFEQIKEEIDKLVG